MEYKKIVIMAISMGTSIIVPSGRDTQSCNVVCIGGSNISCKKNEVNCTGGTSTLPIGPNAVGERIDWSSMMPKAEREILWGTIKDAKKIMLSFPAVGAYELISFKPTKGPQRNKYIQILIASFNLDNIPTDIPDAVQIDLQTLKESGEPFKNVIKFYRKIGNERSWFDMRHIFTNSDPASKNMHEHAMIEPDGTLKTVEPIEETDAEGNKKISEHLTFDLSSLE